MSIFLWWLSILPAVFPFYLIRFQIFGVPTTFLEVVVAATALWGFFVFFHWRAFIFWFKQQWRAGWRSPLWPLLLFLVASTISVVIVPSETLDITQEIVPSRQIAFGVWKGWMVMPILYFFMMWLVPKNEVFWKCSMNALILSGLGLSFWALFQMATHSFMTPDGRASGPFESANYLSLYLGPIVLLGFIQTLGFIRERRFIYSFFSTFITLVIAIALWGTQSYAAFIALAAGVLFYCWGHPHISSRFKWRAASVIVLSFFVGILMLSSSDKFEQFLNVASRSSSSVRLEVYEVALELIREHPILGIGLGQFNLHYRANAHRLLEHLPYEWVMIHPHNLFLALWLNTGLLGLLAMLWLMIFWACRAYRFFLCRNQADSILLLSLSMIAVMLVHGLFDTPFFKNDLAYLWWWVWSSLWRND